MKANSISRELSRFGSVVANAVGYTLVPPYPRSSGTYSTPASRTDIGRMEPGGSSASALMSCLLSRSGLHADCMAGFSRLPATISLTRQSVAFELHTAAGKSRGRRRPLKWRRYASSASTPSVAWCRPAPNCENVRSTTLFPIASGSPRFNWPTAREWASRYSRKTGITLRMTISGRFTFTVLSASTSTACVNSPRSSSTNDGSLLISLYQLHTNSDNTRSMNFSTPALNFLGTMTTGRLSPNADSRRDTSDVLSWPRECDAAAFAAAAAACAARAAFLAYAGSHMLGKNSNRCHTKCASDAPITEDATQNTTTRPALGKTDVSTSARPIVPPTRTFERAWMCRGTALRSRNSIFCRRFDLNSQSK
eukprot:Opistho-2@2182